MTEPEYYDVEKIIDRKKIRGKYLYLVKWKGYSMNECTWEPIDNLENVKRIIDEFNSKYKTKEKEKEKVKKIEKNNEKTNEKINIKDIIKKDDKVFLNRKRKNSESSLKSTEVDIEEINEENLLSEPFIKAKESNGKILSVNRENGELFALVEKKDKNGKIKTEKLKTKDLKKKNPWILVNYYEANIIFC